ncbi:MAG TPA: N-acetylglucosamine-6-phosphate deacetylase [Acetobacteraceae bacterium]|nr:N-acetylglucosamine-6-phosphate deacetylase [Acetobacteraceae bacterium]
MTSGDIRGLRAARVFTGDEYRDDVTLLVEGGRISALMSDPPPGIVVERLPSDLLLAPGFIDLQVNGGGGALFNDSPTQRTLRTIAAAHRPFGTTGLMVTLITDSRDKMQQAAAAVMATDNPAIVGLHLEGPFLNHARKGVHDPAFLRVPDDADLRFLRDEAPRPLVVTLAPEITGTSFIAALVEAGVHVAIGHSAASAGQVADALKAGARGFTHLFNAMPPIAGRDPGVAGTALAESGDTLTGIIADGHHVHPVNLRLALRARGAARLALVTDAMPSVGWDRERFTLQGREIRVADGRLITADNTLAGAHLDMARAVRNAVALMGATEAEALRMASLNPADWLGLADRGRIAPGARADLVALAPGLVPARIWIGGAPC